MLGAERALHLCGGQVECRTAWHARVHARATPQPARGFERDARRAARRGARGAVSRGSPSGARRRGGARSRVRRNSKKCFVFRFLAERRARSARATPHADPTPRPRAPWTGGTACRSPPRVAPAVLMSLRSLTCVPSAAHAMRLCAHRAIRAPMPRPAYRGFEPPSLMRERFLRQAASPGT